MQCCASVSTLQLFTCVVTSLRSFGTAGGGRARGRGARSEAWLSRSSWPWLSSGKPRHRDSAKVSHTEEPRFPNPRLGHKAQTPRSPLQRTAWCPSRTRLGTPRRPQRHPKPSARARPASHPSCSSWGAAPPSFSPRYFGGYFSPRSAPQGFQTPPPQAPQPPPRRQHQPWGEPHSARSPPRGGRRGRASPLSSPRPPAPCLPP